MSDNEEFEDALEEVAPYSRSKSFEPSGLKQFKFSKKSIIKRSVSASEAASNQQKGNNELLPLEDCLLDAQNAIDLFLNNQFDSARDIVEPFADRSIYHALGYGTFMFLKAVMTFEQKHIEDASDALSSTCETINSFRIKKTGLVDGLGKILGREDPNSYTEMELHAEICYAELLLLKAILTICEDESLVSFVNAGLKVKTCYHSYRNCISILEDRNWSCDRFKKDFECGVRMGSGTFNVIVSLLPGRVTKILKFIGLNGDRESGFRDLHRVYEDKNSIRQFASSLFLLGYHLFVSYFLGISKPNLDLCREILDQKMVQYPQGVFFLFFQGRYHFLQGDLDKAIEFYQKSVSSQKEWPQFHHVCYWELFWATSFKRDWRTSYFYANTLFKESRWSKCFYAYQRAALMCMFEEELTPQEKEEQIDLMKNIPSWKQRLGGKSLPMEKFALSKAERFIKQGNRLILPVLELIYVWNGFRIIGPHRELLEPIYVLVEKELKKLELNKDSSLFYNEDLCLLTLLKGMCLKYFSSPYGAEECFETVASYAKKLNADTYLVPYALAERGFLLQELGHEDKALTLFQSAKNDFKSYQLQSRLHFRIHSMETEIKKRNTISGG